MSDPPEGKQSTNRTATKFTPNDNGRCQYNWVSTLTSGTWPFVNVAMDFISSCYIYVASFTAFIRVAIKV